LVTLKGDFSVKTSVTLPDNFLEEKKGDYPWKRQSEKMPSLDTSAMANPPKRFIRVSIVQKNGSLNG
jgi:hypothetical protein